MRYSIETPDGSLLFCYKQKQMEQGYQDRVHCYDELKYVRILEGGGIWRIGTTDYSVEKGDILIMSRADIRQIRQVTQPPLMIEQVDFVPAFLNSAQEAAAFFFRRPPHFQNLLPADPEITQKMDVLTQELRAEQPYKEHALRCKLTDLVIATARLLHAAPAGGRAKGQDTVEQAMHYIRTHFDEPLTLEDLARRFYLSPAYFSRLFRQNCGMVFQEYLMQVRIKEVISLLEISPINILDAALQCGFRSSSGFYRCFRRMTGATPKQFKLK